MATKKTGKSVQARGKAVESTGNSSTPGAKSYKALMVLKGRGLLPRGLKFSVDPFRHDAQWRRKDGSVFFQMSLVDFAKSQAKGQGFAVA